VRMALPHRLFSSRFSIRRSPRELEQRASFDAFFNGRVAKRSLRILVIRKTMVSGAQSPKFACVR
uniref:hypothetical protein n=1 Tax=Candidatus Fimivicinus sp. TaxID=3056640 RepID=UPI003FEF3B4C